MTKRSASARPEATLKLVPRTFDGLKKLCHTTDKEAHAANIQKELQTSIKKTWLTKGGIPLVWQTDSGCADAAALCRLMLDRPVKYGEFIETCKFKNEEDIYQHFVWNNEQVVWAPNSASTWDFHDDASRTAVTNVLKEPSEE